MRWKAMLMLMFAASPLLQAQRIDAIVNAASTDDPHVAYYAVATIFGENLSDQTCSADTLPLPTSLCGTSAVLRSLWNADKEFAVPLFYVSPNQWNVQIPADSLTILTEVHPKELCIGSSCRQVVIKPAAPGIYQWRPRGGRPIAVATHADGSLVTPEAPAREGEMVTLWCTGLGIDVIGDDGANIVPGPGLPAPAAPHLIEFRGSGIGVWLNDPQGDETMALQEIVFAGWAPGTVGLSQINFVVKKSEPVEGGYASLLVDRTVWGTPSRGPYFSLPALLPVD